MLLKYHKYFLVTLVTCSSSMAMLVTEVPDRTITPDPQASIELIDEIFSKPVSPPVVWLLGEQIAAVHGRGQNEVAQYYLDCALLNTYYLGGPNTYMGRPWPDTDAAWYAYFDKFFSKPVGPSGIKVIQAALHRQYPDGHPIKWYFLRKSVRNLVVFKCYQLRDILTGGSQGS